MSIRFNVDRLYFGIRKRDAKTRVTCEVVAFYASNLQAFFFSFPLVAAIGMWLQQTKSMFALQIDIFCPSVVDGEV